MPSLARMRLAVTNSSTTKSRLLMPRSSREPFSGSTPRDSTPHLRYGHCRKTFWVMRMLRRFLLGSLMGRWFGAALPVVAAGAASAAQFPDHPIRVIVSVPAGGGVDTVTRIVTDKMRAALGQPLVVENKPGVSGSLA